MNLILVGYRGSGKTVVGELLAKRLGWQFVDVDHLIANKAGKPIREIFETQGEDGFRRQERDACQSLRKLKRCVIALGGGSLLDPDSRAIVRRIGKIVWLQAPAVVLWSRIKGDPASKMNRPDLTATGGLDEIEKKLSEREPVYRSAAHHSVNTVSQTPAAIAEEVELWYRADDGGRE